LNNQPQIKLSYAKSGPGCSDYLLLQPGNPNQLQSSKSIR